MPLARLHVKFGPAAVLQSRATVHGLNVTPRILYTIGYQGSSRDDLIRELIDVGVDLVIDTRETATSRRPEFRRRVLEQSLRDAGIDYAWFPDLGVPKPLRRYARSHPGVFASAYLQRLRRFSSTADGAARLAQVRSTALLCFESDETECHRSILAERLATISPVSPAHLRVRGRNNSNNQPGTPAMVGAE
jgi:hypothetical protein